jgi:hypothetical protein
MRLICSDNQVREFISLFDLCVLHGFDPVLLLKDGGLLSLLPPPAVSFLGGLDLARAGIILDPHIQHYSWLHRKINPVSIHYQKVIEGYPWIALSPAFQWEDKTQLTGVKLDLLTMLVRSFLKAWDFMSLKSDRGKFYKSIIRSDDGVDFRWSCGYKISGFSRSSLAEFSEIQLLAQSETEENISFHLDPSVLCWPLRVFVAKEDNRGNLLLGGSS